MSSLPYKRQGLHSFEEARNKPPVFQLLILTPLVSLSKSLVLFFPDQGYNLVSTVLASGQSSKQSILPSYHIPQRIIWRVYFFLNISLIIEWWWYLKNMGLVEYLTFCCLISCFCHLHVQFCIWSKTSRDPFPSYITHEPEPIRELAQL